jgi:hypothetical protein
VSAASSPGLALVLAFVREEARRRRCAACGAPLGDGEVELTEVAPERIVAALACTCGTVEAVEITPTTEGGAAQVT